MYIHEGRKNDRLTCELQNLYFVCENYQRVCRRVFRDEVPEDEDVYAEGNKDTRHEGQVGNIGLIRRCCGWLIAGSKIARTEEDGDRMKEWSFYLFAGVSQRNPGGDMYLVGESCI